MKPPAAPIAVIILALVFGTPALVAQIPVPAGGEFQVNTYTLGNQKYPAVAMQPDGGFGVVWHSFESATDADRSSIEARLYAANGAPLAVQGPVNTYTTGYQLHPAVATDGDGNFIIVWESEGSHGSDTDYESIQARRFDADGQPIGDQFQVNTDTSWYQIRPAVAINSTGVFVVVWQSGYEDYDIRGRVFAASGSFIGSEIEINTVTNGVQEEAAVAAGAEGMFIVVWQSDQDSGGDTSGSSIQGRLVSPSGTPLGPQVQVNTYITESQSSPAVASNTEGDFVVVWESRGSSGTDHDSFSIQGRLYTSDGTPVGSDGQVNTYITGSQRRPTVAADAEGDFVVAWESDGSSGNDHDRFSVQGRLYASNTLPVGLQAQVNTTTVGYQRHAAVAMDRHGDFIVVWESDSSSGNDNDGTSIQAQLYHRPLFVDGFESGDTTAWSSVSP